MVFGLCTIGAGAAFTDSADVQYTTAVNVMAGMGILVGEGNDAFNPKGELTRAAAAKIVAYVALGKTTAELVKPSKVFNDVPADHWAAKYINYLYSKGMVSGYGDGNFGPNDSVTVLQFAKMLLSTIGWGKKGEFVGSGWDVNVLIKAIETDLIAGLNSTDTDRVITREEASLFAYNAMTQPKAKTVSVSSVTNEYTNPSAGDSLGVSNYSYATFSGVVTANQANSLNAYTVVSKADGTTNNFNITTDKALLGHYITVYYNDTLKTADDVYYYVDNSTVKTCTAIAKFATEVGTGLYLEDDWYSFANYAPNANSPATTTTAPTAAVGTYILNGNKVVAYLDNAAYSVEQISDITSTAVKFTNAAIGGGAAGAGLPVANVIGEENFNKTTNPYVNYMVVGALYELSPLSMVSDVKITKVTATAITAGGTTYTIGTENTALTLTTNDFTNSYDLYIDKGGKIVANKLHVTDAVSTEVYVTRVWAVTETTQYGATNKYYAQAVNMAGEVTVYQLYSTDATFGALGAATDIAIDDFYKVSEANGYATFTQTGLTTAAITLATVAATAIGIAANDYYTSDVKFIWVDGDKSAIKVTVKEGKQAVAAQNVHYVKIATTTAGVSNVAYVIVDGAYPTAVAGAAKLYFNDGTSDGTNAVGTFYSGYEGVDAKDIVINTLDLGAGALAVGAGNALAQGFYTYTLLASGKYDLVLANTATQIDATITRLFNGYLSTAGVTDATTTNATVVDLETTSDYTVTSVADIVAAMTAGKTVKASFTYNATTNAISNIYVTSIS
jgi:hypothetical protein